MKLTRNVVVGNLVVKTWLEDAGCVDFLHADIHRVDGGPLTPDDEDEADRLYDALAEAAINGEEPEL